MGSDGDGSCSRPFDADHLREYRLTATGSESRLLETALRIFRDHGSKLVAIEPITLTMHAGGTSPSDTAELVLRQLALMGAVEERSPGLFATTPGLLRYLTYHPPTPT